MTAMMPGENPEQGGTSFEALASLEQDVSLFEAMNTLDTSQTAYFNSCRDYTGKPTHESFTKLQNNIQNHGNAYTTVLNVLVDNEAATPKEIAEAAASVLLDRDSQRVAFINTLLEENILKNLDPPFGFIEPETELNDDEIADAKKELVDYFNNLFATGLAEDTQELINMVLSGPAAKRVERNERLKGHAIDISKIAVGATIALAVGSLFKRK